MAQFYQNYQQLLKYIDEAHVLSDYDQFFKIYKYAVIQYFGLFAPPNSLRRFYDSYQKQHMYSTMLVQDYKIINTYCPTPLQMHINNSGEQQVYIV